MSRNKLYMTIMLACSVGYLYLWTGFAIPCFFKTIIKKQLCRGFGLCPGGERADTQGFEEGCREERRRLSVLLG